MSGPNAHANRIRGPRSALTSFLEANNISAARILAESDRRRAAARQGNGNTAEHGDEDRSGDDAEAEDADAGETESQTAQRKRAQEKAIAKVKRDKKLKRKRDAHESEDEYDELADAVEKRKPLAGQRENCAECGQRFTVTAYSKAGQDGGLLCAKCSKEMKQSAAAQENDRSKKKPVRSKRRQVQSDLLDGIVRNGAKSLQELCLETIAADVSRVDSVGDLPAPLLDRLSQIFSKNRLLDSVVLDLLLKPYLHKVILSDCAKLTVDDYKKIFAVAFKTQKLALTNAGQFKNEVIDYLLERKVPITDLQLYAANLVSDEKWAALFAGLGKSLESLKLAWLDFAFHDETVEQLVICCPDLKRVKFKQCFNLGDDTIRFLADLQNLEHLTLAPKKPVTVEPLVRLIDKTGSKLKTLCLRDLDATNDDVLDSIGRTCRRLSKFALTGSRVCTDAAFVKLFSGWENPPLQHVELSSNRHVDHNMPDGPAEPVGLASAGFKALMKHSGSRIQKLDISSCRHITHDALFDVFCGTVDYPLLQEIDISFVNTLDTTVAAGIFKNCPKLKKLVVFGCFNATGLQSPAHVALIGLPTAQEPMVINGHWE